MIRISANLSKKVPMPGIDFSSQQFGASMEIEVSDADQPQAIQAKLQRLYATLSHSIDQQINQANSIPTQARFENAQPAWHPLPSNGNGSVKDSKNSNGRRKNASRRIAATEAQQRAIFAICKQSGVNVTDACANYNAADPSQLHIKDASTLIDELKAHQGNGSTIRQ